MAVGVYKSIENYIEKNELSTKLERFDKQIKDLSSDRSISEDKRNHIIERLTQIQGKDIKISCVGNPEAVKFAKELIDIFKKSGWKVNPRYSVHSIQMQVRNVAIVIKNKENEYVGEYII